MNKNLYPRVRLSLIFLMLFNLFSVTGFAQYSKPELMYFKFDASGNQTNSASSPVGNNPATLDGLTTGSTGQFGTALIGNEGASSSNRLNTGWATNLPSTGWTISFWVNNFPASVSTTRYFFGDASAASFRCFTGGVAPVGGLILRGTGLTDVNIPSIPSSPTVIHIVYTGSAVLIYINGVFSTTTSQSSIGFSGAGPFLVGGYSSSSASFPAGCLMDEFRMYNRALDATEISNTWNIELGSGGGLNATASVVSHVLCHGGSNGSVTVSTSGGTTPYTYNWSTGATTQTVPGLTAGTYLVTVTDASSLSATSSATVTQPGSPLTAQASVTSHVACYGNSSGAVTVSPSGGTSPYSYLWSNSNTNASMGSLPAGTYWVTVTDGHSCTAASSATVTQPATGLTAQASVTSHVVCYGNSSGAVTVSASGGATPYSYLWSNSNTNASVGNLPAGTYWVTITDGQTCTATSSATVTQPGSALAAQASVTSHVTCNGNSSGAVTVSASGGTAPFSYLWSNSNTNASVGSLPAGTYWVTVTDGNSCTATSSATVTQPGSALSAIASVVSHVSCNGGSDGSAIVSAGGGTSPYAYLWSNGASTATASSLTAGTFNVTVTDAHSCTATSSATLTQPAPAPTTVTGLTPICQNTASLYSTTSGMSNYLWSVSAGGAISSGGTTADHSAEVTWNNHGAQSVSVTYTHLPDGCVYAGTLNVSVNPAPTPVISGASVVTVGQTITYTTPLVTEHTYSWSASHGNAYPCVPGMNCLTLTWDFPCGIVNPGYVKVTETDTATGCSTTTTLWITVNP